MIYNLFEMWSTVDRDDTFDADSRPREYQNVYGGKYVLLW